MTQKTPYPGLRSFTCEESKYFFGRDDQTDELLNRLGRQRFLAVVGDSGSGKSSLVRAGMIADLEAGFMASAGSNWRYAEMRPGSNPMERLQNCLLGSGVIKDSDDDRAKGFLHSTLNHGPQGLVNALKENWLPNGTNFLLLVDQFEEIFTLSRKKDRNQADAFVALLLKSIEQIKVPIYIVITMRSDYLRSASLFRGLPEVINDGIYLIPRLTRDERQSIIEAPAAMMGGKLEVELVSKLLNEMAADEVQLPQLQHLLMRMWVLAEPKLADEGKKAKRLVTRQHYIEAGGLKGALNLHACEVFDTLEDKQQKITRVIFSCLCKKASAEEVSVNIRNPTDVQTITDIANLDESIAPVDVQEVIEVANYYRHSACSFLAPPLKEKIFPNTMLDISHESLMSSWEDLSEWMGEQYHLSQLMEELLTPARRWEKARKSFFSLPFSGKITHFWPWRDLGWNDLCVWGTLFTKAKEWKYRNDNSLQILSADKTGLTDRFVRASFTQHYIYIFVITFLAILLLTPAALGYLLQRNISNIADAGLLVIRQERLQEINIASGMILGEIANDEDVTNYISESTRFIENEIRASENAEAIAFLNPDKEQIKPFFMDDNFMAILAIQDKEWISDELKINKMLANSCSESLRALSQKDLIEVFVTDLWGVNVCMSRQTSDFVQSDEDWWQMAFQDIQTLNLVDPQFNVSSISYDDSAGNWSVSASKVISQEGTPVGIMKAVFAVCTNDYPHNTYKGIFRDIRGVIADIFFGGIDYFYSKIEFFLGGIANILNFDKLIAFHEGVHEYLKGHMDNASSCVVDT